MFVDVRISVDIINYLFMLLKIDICEIFAYKKIQK